MKELSQNQAKLIRSLQQKKFRVKEKLFICEGIKIVEELLKSDWETELVVTTSDFLNRNKQLFKKINPQFFITSEKIFSSITSSNSPQGILAIVKIPKSTDCLK